MLKALTDAELAAELATLSSWRVAQGKLRRELEFLDFVEAFAFMTKVAMISEKLDHHPEWFNVYNRVIIELITHDCKAISRRDIEWARAVEALLAAHK